MEYTFKEIEKKSQRRWIEQKTYQTVEDAKKKKYYETKYGKEGE